METEDFPPLEEIINTSSLVVRALIQHKILSKYEDQISHFLEKNRHYLYHQLVSDSLQCCACPESETTIPQSKIADSRLFFKSFRDFKSTCPLQNDTTSSAAKQCIHTFIPQDVDLEEFNLDDLTYFLIEFASLSKEEKNDLYFVNESINKIQISISTKRSLSDVNLEDLQNAVIKLTIPHFYKQIVKKVFNNIRITHRTHSDFHSLFSKMIRCQAESEKQVMPETLVTEMYETKQKIKKLSMNVEFEKLVTARQLPVDQNIKVQWTLETAKEWNVDDIIRNLKRHEKLLDKLPVKILDVYPGSLNIMTLIPNELLYRPQICDRTLREFLTKVVELGRIDTGKCFRMDVRTKIQPPEPFGVNLEVGLITTVRHKINDDEMRRLEREHIPFSGLVTCDGHSIDCIVDKRLETYYNNGGNTGMYLQTQLQEMSKFKQFLVIHKNVSSFIENGELSQNVSLLDATDSNGSFICHFFMTYNILSDINFLVDLLIVAIKNQNALCAKAVAWKITKLFSKTIDLTTVIDIWPGTECTCQGDRRPGGMHFCSNSIVIVVETNADSPQSDVAEFYPIKIKYMKVQGQCEEARCVVKEVNRIRSEKDSYSPEVKGINKREAKQLFSEHRNLCVISPSRLKSKKFNKKQKFLRKPCIQLYCRAKGIIPIGEQHFPSCINSIETDVMEGFAEFLVDDLSMGHEVGVPGSCGTVGGFVRILGDDAFLTCAHVIPGREYLNSDEKRKTINDEPVIAYKIVEENESVQGIPCGKLRNFAFPPDKCKGSSVDAALILINSSFKINQDVTISVDHHGNGYSSKALGLESPYLNHNCLDYREIGTSQEIRTISLGAVSKLQAHSHKIDIQEETHTKFETLVQAIDRLFESDNINDPVHFRDVIMKQDQLEAKNPRQCALYGQISLGNMSFQNGDSGTCVYALDQNNHAGCIGMAIASHPDGGCIITPMKSILNHFKIH